MNYSECNDGNLQSVSGIVTGKILKLEAGALLNHDRTYEITTFPAYLNDAFFIQVPHKEIPQGTFITITIRGTTTIYVGFDPSDSGGFEQSLSLAGFSKEVGQISTTVRNLKEIYSINVNTATSITLPVTTTSQTVMLILAKCSSEG